MKNYRIKKVTDGHSTRYYPQHKRYGLFWYNLFVDEYRDGDELYEVVRRIPYSKFTKSVEGDNANLLKEWARCEKILKSNQTNEYLFVKS